MEFKPHGTGHTNVQAELYQQCKQAGLGCYLEYCSIWNGQKGRRFDAGIHDSQNILSIIEVKNSYRKTTNYIMARIKKWRTSKQKKKYEQFNVPVFVIYTIEQIPKLMGVLKTIGGRG